jgi:hypothetical protein
LALVSAEIWAVAMSADVEQISRIRQSSIVVVSPGQVA